jgi:hypothetical protein
MPDQIRIVHPEPKPVEVSCPRIVSSPVRVTRIILVSGETAAPDQIRLVHSEPVVPWSQGQGRSELTDEEVDDRGSRRPRRAAGPLVVCR